MGTAMWRYLVLVISIPVVFSGEAQAYKAYVSN